MAAGYLVDPRALLYLTGGSRLSHRWIAAISPVDRGATLPEVQATLGHDNIAISGYLHGRPDTSSGLHLDPGVFLDETEASRKR